MPSRSRRALPHVVLAVVATLGTVILPATPARAERLQSDLVIVRSGEVVPEDLYAAGNRVLIEGRVEGDLIAAAFDEVRVTGAVTGNLLVLSGRVVVTGDVGGSIRVVGGSLTVEGTVGGDVIGPAARVRLEPGSSVGRDVVVWAWTADLAGDVGRNVEGTLRRLTLSGAVAGSVVVTVSRLSVEDGASVGGDLRYRSDQEAEIGEATVSGTVIQERPLPVNVRVSGFRLMVITLLIVGALLLGLTITWSVPDRALRAAEAVRRRPLASLGFGALLASVPVLLAGLGGVLVALSPPEAGAPLALVLAPAVLGAGSVLMLAVLAAPVPVAIAGGRLAVPARSIYAAFVVGAVVWITLLFIPWVGWILTIPALTAGLGAWLVSPRRGPVSRV
jgi:cytoskeletal protein CcmA (bactofilin family)